MTADQPLAIYPVRTAPGYWLAAAVMFGLLGCGGGALVFVAATTGRLQTFAPGLIVVLTLAGVAPVVYWATTAAYRIGGGRGAILFFADRLEVPAAAAGRMIALPRAELAATATEKRVRDRVGGFAAATERRGFLVRMRAGARSRALSTLTIASPRAFLADLERYIAGDAPLGPATAGRHASGAPVAPAT